MEKIDILFYNGYIRSGKSLTSRKGSVNQNGTYCHFENRLSFEKIKF